MRRVKRKGKAGRRLKRMVCDEFIVELYDGKGKPIDANWYGSKAEAKRHAVAHCKQGTIYRGSKKQPAGGAEVRCVKGSNQSIGGEPVLFSCKSKRARKPDPWPKVIHKGKKYSVRVSRLR